MSASAPVVFITGPVHNWWDWCSAVCLCCQVFASRGCTVYASARSRSSMEGEELSHPKIHKLLVDVTSEESIKSAVDEIYRNEGRIDVVISNAGSPGVGPLLDIPIEHTRSVMDTNYFGFVRLCNNIAPRMAAQPNSKYGQSKGLIVAIGSIVGEFAFPWMGVYNASKAALHLYAETLEMECRPLGVDVMLVSAGTVISNFAKNGAKTGYHEPSSNSLYKSFESSINYVAFMGEKKENGPMDTLDFANQLSDYIVNKRSGKVISKPVRYVSLGGSSWIFKVLKWFPRQKIYDMIWSIIAGK